MKPKVLILQQLVGLGGGETSLAELLIHLKQGQFEPVLLTPREGPLTSALSQEGIAVEFLGADYPKSPFGQPLKYLWTVQKIRSIITQHNVRVVHANDWPPLMCGALAAKLSSVPLLWTCHGPIDRVWSTKLFASFANQILAVSTYVKQSFAGSRLEQKVQVVPLGVDPAKFAPRKTQGRIRSELGIPADCPIISIIGRFQEVKGHELFLEAAQQILKVEPNVRFLIVGANIFDIPEDARNEEDIRAQVAESTPLRDRVLFTGFRQDIPELLNETDVLVSSSKKESFGMIILEAMSCQTAVVSTNSGGPSDLIPNRTTGFLVPHDPTQITEKVLELLHSPPLRKQMGEQARQRVLQNFSIHLYKQRIEEIYSRYSRDSLAQS